MGEIYKPIGRAVAIGRGHYPLRDGRQVSIAPGQTFEIFDGLDKGKWFTVLKGAETPAPVAPPTPAPVEPDTLAAAAGVERKRKAANRPPTADELV